MKSLKKEDVKGVVKEAYGKIATGQSMGCGCGCDPCAPTADEFAKSIGYSDEELKAIPGDANLGLSCGNPTALADLKEGEVVLDLGSGAGFDCFLVASKVGPAGKVIGVDMTPEMVTRAKEHAHRSNISHVEFRLGEIEQLPVEDGSVDVVISNCVINLSSDKPRVFSEIYRVLKPGGRIAISDMALLKELPEKIRKSIAAYVGCVGGAMLVDDYRRLVEAAGFHEVNVSITRSSSCIASDTKDPIGKIISDDLEKETIRDFVVSVSVAGRKPQPV